MATSIGPSVATTSRPAGKRSAAIRVRGLRKRFRKFTVRGQYTTLKTSLVGRLFGRGPAARETFLQVLDGIDLEVPHGQAVGVIGRNGSGKSTLLKLVAGILKPDAGSVEVDGRISPLIELGAGFHPEFSGRENIHLNGIVLGLSRRQIEERFDAIVDFADLREFIDDPVRTYSSGMYMRLGFSIAVHASPDILLIDEILAVGDQGFARKCKEWIAGFLAEGKTILLVSHDLSAVERWCHEAIWIDTGRIRMRGAPHEVISHYLESVEGGPETAGTDVTGPPGGWPAGIESIAIAGPDGPGRERFQAGEDVVLEIGYRVRREKDGLGFGVTLRRMDGACGFGTSTVAEGVAIPGSPGRGRISCRLPNLRLLRGSYVFDVWLHRKDGVIIDQRLACAEFTFEPGGGEPGVFRSDPQWRVEGSGET